MKIDNKIFKLFTPSWLVNFVGIALAILLVSGVIVLSRFASSDVRQQIFSSQQTKSGATAQTDDDTAVSDDSDDPEELPQGSPEAVEAEDPAVSDTSHSVGSYISNNKFLASLPLLLMWAAVGFVVYYLAISVGKVFGEAVELHDAVGYVHASRKTMVREAILHFGVRLAAVAGWFIFLELTSKLIFPYALAAANIASQTFTTSSAVYIALALAIIYVDIWLQAIFLRLIALKVRVFGSSV